MLCHIENIHKICSTCRNSRTACWWLETTSRATKTDSNCWKLSETCQHWSPAQRVAASARSCWLEELRENSNAPLGACYYWWWWWWWVIFTVLMFAFQCTRAAFCQRFNKRRLYCIMWITRQLIMITKFRQTLYVRTLVTVRPSIQCIIKG